MLPRLSFSLGVAEDVQSTSLQHLLKLFEQPTVRKLMYREGAGGYENNSHHHGDLGTQSHGRSCSHRFMVVHKMFNAHFMQLHTLKLF